MEINIEIVRIIIKLISKMSWKNINEHVNNEKETDKLQRWYFENRYRF